MLSKVFKKENRKKELLKEMDDILYKMEVSRYILETNSKYECFIKIDDRLSQKHFDDLLRNVKDLGKKMGECLDLFRLKR